MTSRELTSGFDFWSAGHLCMAVVHLLIKFGVDIQISTPNQKLIRETSSCLEHMCVLISMTIADIWTKFYIELSPELLTFLWNSRWRLPPSWIISWCEFGHSGVLIVWYLCSVQNLVQISVIVTDRHTYASDLHLMTSRQWTSGFVFWKRGHLRVAVVHFTI